MRTQGTALTPKSALSGDTERVPTVREVETCESPCTGGKNPGLVHQVRQDVRAVLIAQSKELTCSHRKEGLCRNFRRCPQPVTTAQIERHRGREAQDPRMALDAGKLFLQRVHIVRCESEAANVQCWRWRGDR